MKSVIKYCLLLTIVLAITSCSKVADLPFYAEGKAPVLSVSSTTIAPPPANSGKVALVLTWTNPAYATDTNTVKYTVEIDKANNNFQGAYTKEISKDLTASFTAKELNTFLLANGFAFGVAVPMEVRVLSSYANNNEQLSSNTVVVQMTPYKIPPKVALPATGRLFIVGDASDFGWTNDPSPAFPPERELTRTSETTWEAIFNLHGSGGYKLLQEQGNWDTQFHMVDGGTAEEGSFVQENADPTFPSPATAGFYHLVFDFQTGKFTVTKVDNGAPTELYITGDATPGGWVNNPPEPSQKFTALSNGLFELTIHFNASGAYKFLSTSGAWQPQFGGSSATGGALGANWGGGNDPDAIPAPADAGDYKIRVNYLDNTYTVTKL